MKTTKELLGGRIKELRKLRKLSQEKLSEKVDIDSKHLSRIEVGRGFPSLDTLERLANALNVELKDFFEFSHETPGPVELQESLNCLLKEADEDRLRLLVKIVRAVVR
ncbi:MAG: helix-turn-helix domain-containing protein [Thermodesulfobacteriota bacterium]